MKTSLRLNFYIVLTLFLVSTSCRKEEFESQGVVPEQGLAAGGNVTDLLLKTTMNDGSVDNILDQASCFSLKLPVNVIVNATEVIVDGSEDFEVVEDLLDEDDDGPTDGAVELVYPVTIIANDFSETVVTNAEELNVLRNNCPTQDEDIECIDIIYPISISIFNTVSETFDNASILNDAQLYHFVDNLMESDIATISFPMTVLLSDESQVELNDLDALENIIEMSQNDCDEDDDNNFNDDDCDDCNSSEFSDAWLTCTAWEAHMFRLNDNRIEDQYEDILFNFQSDGNVLAISDSQTLYGTWAADGSGNITTLQIDIPGLDDFNRTWVLEEIKDKGDELDVRLYIGEENELHFQSTCADGDPDNQPLDIGSVLEDGIWFVDSFMNAAIDETADFNGYELNFNSDGTVVADNGTPINGTWSVEDGITRLALDFGAASPFNNLNLLLKIDRVSEDRVELREIGVAPTDADTLVLAKQ